MQRYDSYKDSGVKWLGEIPSHWEMKRWRFLMSENTTKNTNCKERLQLQFRYGDIVRKANQSEESDVLDTISKYTVVEPDDIMINGLNLNYDFISQRVAQVQERGVITSAYISLRPTEIANSRYFTYFLKSMDAKKMFHGMGTGIRLTLSYNELKNHIIPCPSPEEQSAIAAYLDSATAKIDAAIAQQQKMIDLLNERKQIIINNAVTRGLNPNAKMKDSGVEWIGVVPEHWDIKTLKRVFEKRIAGSWGEDENISAVNNVCLRIADFNYSSFSFKVKDEYTIRSYSKEEIASKHLVKGDILIEKSGGGDKTPVGRCVVFDLDIETPMFANFMEKLVARSFANPNYVVYLLSTLYSNGVIWNYIKATTGIQNLDITSLLSKESICLPPIDEQKQIVGFLNEKTKTILDAIDLCNQKISLLQERKQIIINEVVTGKVKRV